MLAQNDNVQPKNGESITIKIKIPDSLKNHSGLDIIYIDSKGNVTSQNAIIVKEGNTAYLVFKAAHFSKYAIVYTKPTSSFEKSGSGSIVITSSMHESYINGYPDGTFQPDSQITRAETAVILSRVSGSYNSNLYYQADFKDLEPNGWYLNAVGYGSQTGLLVGYEDGAFHPNGQITRAEFAAIIARFLKLDAQVTKTPLSDISGHWSEGYIATLFDKGLISGYEDGTFRPDARITRGEAVKIINAAIGRTPYMSEVDANIGSYTVPFNDVNKSHWAYYDILEAAISHKVSDFN